MGTWLSGLEFKSPARHDPNACNLSANRTETNRSWEFTGWVSFTFSERPYLRNRQNESKIRFLWSSHVCLVVDIDKHTLEFKERTWVVT